MDIEYDKLKPDVRSIIGKKRFRLEQLENLVSKYSNYYLALNVNPNTPNPFKEYFSWVGKKLKTIDNENEEKTILSEDELLNFEHRLEKYVEKVETHLIKTSYTFNSTNVNPSSFNQGYFLERGSKIFINVIDSFHGYIEPERIDSIIKSKEPNALSYVYIATLARYTLPRTSLAYRQFYKHSLTLAKKAIPKTYSEPSHDNVIALILLSYIYISHFHFNTAGRFFTLAIRMAQVLGYDNYEDISYEPPDCDEELKEKLKEKLKGAKLWTSLSLTYLVLSTIIPTLQFVNLKPPTNFSPITFYPDTCKTMSHSLIKNSDTNSSKDVIFQANELGMRIFSHIQSVKMQYKSNTDSSNIPPEALRLPPAELNSSILKLLGLQNRNASSHTSSHSIPFNFPECFSTNPYVEHCKGRPRLPFLTLLKIYTTIYLYYPSVLVYPQPVELSKEETSLLFESSNTATDIYLSLATSLLEYDSNKPLIESTIEGGEEIFVVNKPLIEMVCSSPHEQYVVNYDLYIFLRVSSLIFVYLNIIDKANATNPDPYYLSLLTPCINRCVSLVSILYSISKSPKRRDRYDSVQTLKMVANVLDRFSLPITLLDKIKPMLAN